VQGFVTSQGRTTIVILLAGLVIAGGAFALGKATGSSGSDGGEAQPLDQAAGEQASVNLTRVPAAPPMRARPTVSGGDSGSTASPQAEAPQAEAPAPQTPTPSAPTPQQPAAQQPETPVAGE
jgi:hypothetical protein